MYLKLSIIHFYTKNSKNVVSQNKFCIHDRITVILVIFRNLFFTW